MSQASNDVLRERTRQKAIEGFTADHDDKLVPGYLSSAALSLCGYAASKLLLDINYSFELSTKTIEGWLTEDNCKISSFDDDPRQALVKAAALIIAEIEKIDR